MLDTTGYIKIIDFGLAKVCKNDQIAVTQCGTPEYFAPEMLKGQGYNQSVDWWAVGIICYEMVFGVTPFFSKNKQMLYGNILTKQLKFHKAINYTVLF